MIEFTPEVLEKLAATGEGMPVYLDEREPELEDPADELAAHQWQPACSLTSKLTRCLEAIRDVTLATAPLVAVVNPKAEKRLVKQVIPPLYNLAIAVRDLFFHVQSTSWTTFKKRQQQKLVKRFEQFGRDVPTKFGSLKAARDKIAAHLDRDLCTTEYRQFWESFGLADVLGWIMGCIKMFEELLQPDIYSWRRSSGYSNVLNLMNVDRKEISFLIENGTPTAMLKMRFVNSPKEGIAREGRELVAACVVLRDRLGLAGGEAESAK